MFGLNKADDDGMESSRSLRRRRRIPAYGRLPRRNQLEIRMYRDCRVCRLLPVTQRYEKERLFAQVK
jgi:hypothetical protein